jgi:hypothetical protein
VVYTPGSITKWSRLAGVCAVVALVVPDGAYRWTALSIAGVFLVIAATRVPRQAWRTHTVLVAALGCVIAAFLAVALLPLSTAVTVWTLSVTGGVFVGVVVFSAVRLLRKRKDGTQGT